MAEHLLCAIAERRDRSAFTELFNHFAPRIKRYLMSLGSAVSEAEELTQEVMLTVWRKADQFDPARSAVSTWIFRIARNRRIDSLRVKRPEIDPRDPTTLATGTEPSMAPVEGERLRGLLGALPGEQAEVLRSAYYEGKSLGDIARATKVPLGTVKSRYRLAMERLRATLGIGVKRA